jgi:nicotinate dehydrogenase subunit A
MPKLTLHINGQERKRRRPRPRRAAALRVAQRVGLGLTGAKFGCGLGQCGACTVIVDGDAVRSCLVPVAKATRKKVTTVEGLGTLDKPHPLQAAFVAEQATQCGYCATGMVMTGAAALARKPDLTREEAQQALAGNLCRCGTHERALRAMLHPTAKGALVINPGMVKAQLEGNILQTLSRTLFEEVAFDRTRVTSVDWASYPILTFPDAPEILIDLAQAAGSAAARRRRSSTRCSTALARVSPPCRSPASGCERRSAERAKRPAAPRRHPAVAGRR